MQITPRSSIRVRLLAASIFLIGANVPLQAFAGNKLQFDHVVDFGCAMTQAFLQDREGFLWFGSSTNGLFRYDGYQVKSYGIDSGVLVNGEVTRIIEDATDPNILWMATLEGGFSRFDKITDTFTHYTYNPDVSNGLAGQLVYDILQDGQQPNILWIVGDELFQQFDKRTGAFTPNLLKNATALPEDIQFFSILEDRAHPNALWIASAGLVKFDKGSQTFIQYLHDPDNPESLGFESDFIGSMTQDKDHSNILWLGYWDGPVLDKFDTTTGVFTHYAHDPKSSQSLRDGPVQLIYDDGNGTLWLGGWGANNGLTAFDKTTATFAQYQHSPGDPRSLSTDMIVNVSQDRTGILWIVNTTGKIDKYDPYTQNFTVYQNSPLTRNSLANSTVVSIAEDRDGLIWFGTAKGLTRFEPDTETFTNYANIPGLSDRLIFCAYEDSAQNLWVGANLSPLLKIEKTTGRILDRVEIPEGSSVADILEDPQDPNILWVGLYYNVGFAKYHKQTRKMRFYAPDPYHSEKGVSSEQINKILHDRQEPVLWLGSFKGNGLDRFDKTTETFTHYSANPNDSDSLSYDNIGALYQDASGTLWIGTLGGGLNKFNPTTAAFTRYGQPYGVPAFVNMILEDDQGYLWLSTNHGILRFDPKTERVDRQYTKNDGLQDPFLEGSGLRSRDGAMWFGGTNGVNRFHPVQLASNPHIPPIVLTSLTQGGEEVNWDDHKVPTQLEQITLDWRHNFFEFEYVALNYTIPAKNQYQYMLAGLDTTWYHAGTKRTGRYVGIPAGTYTLRIIGSNNDGVWNNEGVALKITVVPAFWKTWQFYTLCGLLAAAAPFAYITFRIRRLHKFNRELGRLLDARTEQLKRANATLIKMEKEQLERQMAGGFAHEMRNALVSVIIGLKMVFEENQKTLCQKNSAILGKIYDALEPYIPEDQKKDVLQLFMTIDRNEETLDTVLKKTQESTTRALDVTKLILEYSRLGRTDVGQEDVNMEELVKRVVEEHAAEFAALGILLLMNGTTSHCVQAYSSHIHSMLNNLVLNARDALLEVTDKRPKSIKIDLEEDADHLLLSVTDNANGIPEGIRAKIFDPFFSTKPTTGTGLGLSYVSKLVSLHQGLIDVFSETGRGTTFTITLPFHKE